MTRQILYVHWKAARGALLPLVIAAFALPLLSVQGLELIRRGRNPELWTYGLIEAAQLWTPFFPLLAAVLGTTIALTAWNWDHRGDHVYALSLPVERWRYAAVKMASGAALLVPAALTFLAGASLASALVALPAGLSAYPVALTVRFFLAALLIYAVVFAMAAGTTRTVVLVSTTFVGALVVGSLVVSLAAVYDPNLAGLNFAGTIGDALTSRPGPLGIFTGSWMLIDV